MKYISILLILLALLTGCGKKTDPISKDTLEKASLPSKYVLKATSEGFFIRNNEDGILIIERGQSENGECPTFSLITKLPPKQQFVDKDVELMQNYTYRLTQVTVKYGLVSDSAMKPVIYTIAPNIEKAEFTPVDENYVVSVTATSPFMRMDVISGGNTLTITGEDTFTVSKQDVADDTITLKLTDDFGNTGSTYTLKTKVVPVAVLDAPKNIVAAYSNGALRIVWDSVKGASSYDVKVCDNVSCETVNVMFTSAAIQKEFDKCVNITVNAVGSDIRSDNANYRFCK